MKKKTTVAQNCKECKHSRFDEVIGEYKCTVRCHYIHEPDIEAVACDEYKHEEKRFEETEEEE
jgi:hypothetical protein